MKKAFNILVHRNDENVHLKLIGDFDEMAVIDFLNTLNLYSRYASKIFIHTDALNVLRDYDEQHFLNHLHDRLKQLNIMILSTGRFSSLFKHALDKTLFVNKL